ncbi:hypothetical protein ABB37_00085 [Leptomonas pyrrhocoris]|uniref:IQ motif and ubiquitin-like domain-containing protein n=1 Tax=Leptomonas pyrrhocoris TaxID=157538 RepID=A0A0M9G9R7_LEPPY|nr:hypothetical protein ABB37_00085 [Leptomonas pyrrhocoris]XP_015664153.1 hypothetical protein ABB37_00085 [Leptomonas pyrrhocoris]XP_015664154.1 hypothetical protein ABB37_00085 [Leptomonas pyrrhocoris]KPA85713.1 hypothetical protein ABB37_00085 [Leptomonas pyrrhocoris]KPA85714.1 hypothetical protein ABB37_00085 [Leptomonas pyrrhocoris]KPA85715.1 hypothetical protein ABB37_00085 [Leptomonas pyrrhocoris]|eukprot:XP_015664152.1 hypothetical protein ABB37_00085 [Leptomonas pyrrhocoris]
MEDSSTNPDHVEEQITAGLPTAEEPPQASPEEEEAMEEQDGPSPLSHGGAEGDDSEVGHEVAPPRASPDPNDVGYFARLNPHAEDLADNVASDVRRVPSAQQRQHDEVGHETHEYEDIPTEQDDQEGQRSGNGATVERRRSADASGAPPRRPSATTVAQSTTLARQPCHGTQVDAETDIPAEAEQHHDVDDDGATAAAAGAAEEPRSEAATSSDDVHVRVATAAAAAAPPGWSQLPQAAHGTAEVTAMLLPMQSLTRITVPVHNPNLYRPPPSSNVHDEGSDEEDEEAVHGDGDTGLRADRNGGRNESPYWVLIAKELFEVLAERLHLHPESFHVFHQHKRLRFMGTLFLDCDVTSSPSSSDPATAENNRAEPIWVSVTFPNPHASLPATEARSKQPFTSTAPGAEDEADEAHTSLGGVPAHLAELGPADYVARCIRVRRRKAQIPPRTLVEGRHQGYSYDEVIQRTQTLHDAAVQEEGKSSGIDTAASNFTIIAIVQESPVTPTKPFLGGYRDKRQPDHVLLHAATQLYHRDLEYSPFAKSGVAMAAAGGVDRTSRHTQTFGISRSCQTHREACVQTPRVDLLLDTSHDFVVVARPYFTSGALQALRDEMAVVIQKMYRQWKARRVRSELEEAESARQHRAGARQRREEALHAAVEDAAQLRRDDPRSAMDFERVRQEIIDWRAAEAARIQRDATLSSADASAALLAITKKELQLLQQLDQRRREVGKTREELSFVHQLDRMAAPKQWGTVYVETPETERAGELRDLYERLAQTSRPARGGATVGGGASSSTRMASRTKPDATAASPLPLASSSPHLAPPGYVAQGSSAAGVPQSGRFAAPLNASDTPALAMTSTKDGLTSTTAARLDILLRVKWTVREFDATSPLARELGELIDREADLLHRGRKDASLVELRKRIQTLFAQFTEDPEYNPGVKGFVRTARGRARVRAVEAERQQTQAKTLKNRN